MCQPAPGIRCPHSQGQRSKDLNATNKRIRRATSNLAQDDISDENRKKLEDKLEEDYSTKEGLLMNPENTRKDATTKTPGQIESQKLREEKKKEAEDRKNGENQANYAGNKATDTAVAEKKAASTSTVASPDEDRSIDSRGFDRKTGMHHSGGEFDPETGYDADGLDYNLFNESGIHHDTGTKYNEDGVNRYGIDENGNEDEDFYIPTFDKTSVEDVDVDVEVEEGYEPEEEEEEETN